MGNRYNIKSVRRSTDGPRRLKLVKAETGKVWLVIGRRYYNCDTIGQARSLAHQECQQILHDRKEKLKHFQESPIDELDLEFGGHELHGVACPWVEYKIIVQSDVMKDGYQKFLLPHGRVIVCERILTERYPQGKPVQGFEKGQAGRPESNRRKF